MSFFMKLNFVIKSIITNEKKKNFCTKDLKLLTTPSIFRKQHHNQSQFNKLHKQDLQASV